MFPLIGGLYHVVAPMIPFPVYINTLGWYPKHFSCVRYFIKMSNLCLTNGQQRKYHRPFLYSLVLYFLSSFQVSWYLLYLDFRKGKSYEFMLVHLSARFFNKFFQEIRLVVSSEILCIDRTLLLTEMGFRKTFLFALKLADRNQNWPEIDFSWVFIEFCCYFYFTAILCIPVRTPYLEKSCFTIINPNVLLQLDYRILWLLISLEGNNEYLRFVA